DLVTGAEIVRVAVSSTSGRILRQPCFRFPGHHHAHCDYASGDKDNVVPENLIRFGDAKSALTRAIRELVCTGIQMGAFSQRSIRDMRQWFFERKSEARIKVTLDPRVPRWIADLRRTSFHNSPGLPPGVVLTEAIASLPGFDWTAEAKRIQHERHKVIL